MFGQTLFDLASHLSIETSSLAPMFTVRAVGHSLGSAASGPCFDRFHKLSFWQLIVIITVVSISQSTIVLNSRMPCIANLPVLLPAGNCILPVSVHLAMVGVIMFLEGICFGALDNGIP